MEAQSVKQGQRFTRVETRKGPLYVLTPAHHGHDESMEALANNRLRPLTREEALSYAPSELMQVLKGNYGYLADRVLDEDDSEARILSGGYDGRQLFFHDCSSPDMVASVVFGVKIDQEPAESGGQSRLTPTKSNPFLLERDGGSVSGEFFRELRHGEERFELDLVKNAGGA